MRQTHTGRQAVGCVKPVDTDEAKRRGAMTQTYASGLTKHCRWRARAQMVHLLSGRQRPIVKYRVFEYCEVQPASSCVLLFRCLKILNSLLDMIIPGLSHSHIHHICPCPPNTLYHAVVTLHIYNCVAQNCVNCVKTV